MSGRNSTKEANDYFYQEYKIACPNLDYAKVMTFIRSGEYNTIGMTLKDIDVTMDYADSFDKDEIVNHLVTSKGFRE